jgi:hypothetical protein
LVGGGPEHETYQEAVIATLAAAQRLEHARRWDQAEGKKIDWALEGGWLGGGVPYGFRKVAVYDGSRRRWKLEPVDSEQEWIALIKKMAKRKLSSRRIADQLIGTNVNPTGVSMTASAARLFLYFPIDTSQTANYTPIER